MVVFRMGLPFLKNTMKRLFWAVLPLTFSTVFGQSAFPYEPALQSIQLQGMPGLHSYAHGQHQGKLLIIGGRLDGIHARQPFNAFPSSMNNTNVYVVEPSTGNVWSTSITSLPTGLAEQLQSTNMNYAQAGDTLYLLGGYAFSASANDHVTHNRLTTVHVSGLIQAITNQQAIGSFFKTTTDTLFQNTGGQLGFLDGTFYLVGGQIFTGRYNPMGHATYTQRYLHRVVKFTINNQGATPTYAIQQHWSDPTHLRRRDYNLLPHVFEDGSRGFLISSGVFQPVTDLPFLYPVEIRPTGYTPRQDFSQLFSHYHSGRAVVWDSIQQETHSLFFGGMAQYYLVNGSVIQDNQVPFVKTISRVTRTSNGSFQEHVFSAEMPGLKGAGAEFFALSDLNDVIRMPAVAPDTLVLGYLLGGIQSSALNPFSTNQTGLTSADAGLWKVYLYKPVLSQDAHAVSDTPFTLYPNPGKAKVYFHAEPHQEGLFRMEMRDAMGRLVQHQDWGNPGDQAWERSFLLPASAGVYFVQIYRDGEVVFDQRLVVE